MIRLIFPINAPTWLFDVLRDIERGFREVSAKGFKVTATGTGAAQDIALPKADLLADDLLVFVSGALVASGYTVSGSTLTLTAASSAPIVILER